ncbi:MAG: hypothetical protein E7012_04035 [Alphaproteobacteria bacterium]|nr:hypothetical protein [Alphaproteobacteria bacterium]
MLKYIKLFIIALFITSCGSEPEPKPTTPLMIKTSNGDIRFMVEVATTPEDLKTGLMYRTNLGFNSGMIFNIYPVRPMSMWMKNTKIPLDMLFIGPDTSIIMIKENAEPMSEAHIECKEPVRAVIEINAGQVKRHGIKIGDKVTHMILNSMVDIKTPGPEAQINTAPQAPAPITPQANIAAPIINQPSIPALPAQPTTPTAQAPKVVNNADTTAPAPVVSQVAQPVTQAPKLPVIPPKL